MPAHGDGSAVGGDHSAGLRDRHHQDGGKTDEECVEYAHYKAAWKPQDAIDAARTPRTAARELLVAIMGVDED
jgi:hypothetical protein